jgi:hypothetical protein
MDDGTWLAISTSGDELSLAERPGMKGGEPMFINTKVVLLSVPPEYCTHAL